MAKRPALLDRVLGAVGLARKPQTAQRAYYAAAAVNRLNAEWIMGPVSADQELRADLRLLRDRARQLMRDNPYARRYVNLQAHGIIGPHGVAMQARAANARGVPSARFNAAIEGRWAEWCRPEHCTVDGRLGFAEFSRLVVETWKGEGEAFVQLVDLPTEVNPFGFALQLLDADLVDEKLNDVARNGRGEIRMGVELNERGRPVAYWVLVAHPGEAGGERRHRRIPATEIIHLYRPTRAGQTRGVTAFAPVMSKLKMLDGLEEAVLVLQRAAACKMGFLTVDPEQAAPLVPEGGAASVSWDAEPGKIEQLPAGFDFKSWDPGAPGDEYDPFTRNARQSVAAGLDVSYASLTGDLSQANYSSARVGMTTERDGYKRDAELMVALFHDRIYRGWLRAAFLANALPTVPAGDHTRYPVEWQARGFDWIDPQKDIEASLAEVDAGLNSLTDIAAAKGRDFADIIAKRAAEMQLAADAGVTLTLGKSAAPPHPYEPNMPGMDGMTGPQEDE
jgi:lambda family phage portal protein